MPPRKNEQAKTAATSGTSLGYRAPSSRGSMTLTTADGTDDASSDNERLDEVRSLIRDLVSEIIRRCGSQWCLYTKGRKGGKRRRLGTHASKAAAQRQERAIKSHGG